MKSIAFRLLVVASLCSTACMKRPGGNYGLAVPPAPVMEMAGEGSVSAGSGEGEAVQIALPAGRKLIWNAELRVEVDALSNAVAHAAGVVAQSKGYVESQSEEEYQARLIVRVPAAALSPTLSSLGALGSTVVSRVSSSDVTEQYVDTETRMKSARALRDRLQGLLERATNVTEVLAVERELTRVQTEIDSTEARLRVMAGQIDLATIDVTYLKRTPPAVDRTIYGPVGLIVKGLGWVLEKLWIIRE